MSIHSGHPEKYEQLCSEIGAGYLSDTEIEQIKIASAWVPIQQQREQFALIQAAQQEQAPDSEPAQKLEIPAKGIVNVGNTCYMASLLQVLH